MFLKTDLHHLTHPSSGALIKATPNGTEYPTVMNTPSGPYVLCDVHEPIMAVHTGAAFCPKYALTNDLDMAAERERYNFTRQREEYFKSCANMPKYSM